MTNKVSDTDNRQEKNGKESKKINFASSGAGAIILDKSPSTAKGFSNLLDDDKDRYGISPCKENKWVVIGLSEDILISSIAIANYEKYSSLLKDFQVLTSASYPTEEWIDLGEYQAQPMLGEQLFSIKENNFIPHTRYLKFKFLSHYGNEDLCTLSQIKVYGTTVIASFHQEVKKSDTLVKDMLNQLKFDETNTLSTTNMNANTNTNTNNYHNENSSQSVYEKDLLYSETPSTASSNIDNEDNIEILIPDSIDILTNDIIHNIPSPVSTIINAPDLISIDDNILLNSGDVSDSSVLVVENIETLTESTITVDTNSTTTDSLSNPTVTSIDTTHTDKLNPSTTISVHDDTHNNKTSTGKPSINVKEMSSIVSNTNQSIAVSNKEILLNTPNSTHDDINKHNDGDQIDNTHVIDTLTSVSNNISKINTTMVPPLNQSTVINDTSPSPSDLKDTTVFDAKSIDNAISMIDSKNITTFESNSKNHSNSTSIKKSDDTLTQNQGSTSSQNSVNSSQTNTTVVSINSTTTSTIIKPITTSNISIVTPIFENKTNETLLLTNDTTSTNITKVSIDNNNTTASTLSIESTKNTLNTALTVTNTPPMISNTINSNVTSTMNNTSLHIPSNSSTSIINTTVIASTNIPSTTSTTTQQMTHTTSSTSTTTSSTTTSNTINTNLSRIPACLDTLKFQEFKTKMEAKFFMATRETTGNDQENVFSQLMQKIKVLEMSDAIYELYAIQMSECHHAIMIELWKDHRVKLSLEKLTHIEDILHSLKSQQAYIEQLKLALQLSQLSSPSTAATTATAITSSSPTMRLSTSSSSASSTNGHTTTSSTSTLTGITISNTMSSTQSYSSYTGGSQSNEALGGLSQRNHMLSPSTLTTPACTSLSMATLASTPIINTQLLHTGNRYSSTSTSPSITTNTLGNTPLHSEKTKLFTSSSKIDTTDVNLLAKQFQERHQAIQSHQQLTRHHQTLDSEYTYIDSQYDFSEYSSQAKFQPLARFPGQGLNNMDDCKIFSSNLLALQDCYENVYLNIDLRDREHVDLQIYIKNKLTSDSVSTTPEHATIHVLSKEQTSSTINSLKVNSLHSGGSSLSNIQTRLNPHHPLRENNINNVFENSSSESTLSPFTTTTNAMNQVAAVNTIKKLNRISTTTHNGRSITQSRSLHDYMSHATSYQQAVREQSQQQSKSTTQQHHYDSTSTSYSTHNTLHSPSSKASDNIYRSAETKSTCTSTTTVSSSRILHILHLDHVHIPKLHEDDIVILTVSSILLSVIAIVFSFLVLSRMNKSVKYSSKYGSNNSPYYYDDH